MKLFTVIIFVGELSFTNIFQRPMMAPTVELYCILCGKRKNETPTMPTEARASPVSESRSRDSAQSITSLRTLSASIRSSGDYLPVAAPVVSSSVPGLFPENFSSVTAPVMIWGHTDAVFGMVRL